MTREDTKPFSLKFSHVSAFGTEEVVPVVRLNLGGAS
jgi:hypothetical protein